MNDTIVSFIRTYTPVVVGAVLSYLARHGFEIQVNPVAASAFVIAVYYALARFLEKRWPVFGWLLGTPKEPAYQGTPPAVPGA